jgi:polar amino acid transport system permease protein
MSAYDWDFGWVWTYREALLQGLLTTVLLNAVVLLFGTMAGVLVGLLRCARSRVLRACAVVYVDLFRTLPVLVLLVWFFFCVPILLGGVRISPVTSAVIVLSLNLSAFVAEIFRAGIEAVPRQYVDAGYAAGLSRAATLRFIIVPIGVRIMIPPLVGQYINTIKLSVLASIISVPELLQKTTDLISQVYRPLEFYTALAGLFLILLLPGTIWSRRLEQPRQGRDDG